MLTSDNGASGASVLRKWPDFNQNHMQIPRYEALASLRDSISWHIGRQSFYGVRKVRYRSDALEASQRRRSKNVMRKTACIYDKPRLDLTSLSASYDIPTMPNQKRKQNENKDTHCYRSFFGVLRRYASSGLWPGDEVNSTTRTQPERK